MIRRDDRMIQTRTAPSGCASDSRVQLSERHKTEVRARVRGYRNVRVRQGHVTPAPKGARRPTLSEIGNHILISRRVDAFHHGTLIAHSTAQSVLIRSTGHERT